MLVVQALEQRVLLAAPNPLALASLDAPANAAPVNSVPGSQETVLDTALAFTEYRGNLISISDPDAGNLEVEMQLQATNGLVTLVNRNLVASGLTYLAGDGLDDAVIKVRGKIDDINTALSWTAFIPNAGYTGANGQITITTNDLGNSGDGGPRQDVDSIAINVKTPADLFDPSPTWKTFPGLLDESFDADGVRILNVGNTTGSYDDNDRIWNMELLPDGKILAAANVDGVIAMLRFNEDLNLDTTFGSGGLVKTTRAFGNSNYRAFLTQDAQGRILLAGYEYVYRYLANGSLDTSFGNGGSVALGFGTRFINDIGFQGDGDILVAASYSSTNNSGYGGIWRMGEDGQNPIHIISTDRTGMIVWDDGRIIVSDQDFDVQRYTRDAVLEQSYDFNHGTTSSIFKLPDNRFLIVGYDSGDGQDISVTRHLATGALDTTFGSSGRTLLPVLEGDDQGYRATLQHDGRILIAGHAQVGTEDGYDIAVARLSYDGVPDTNFFTGNNDATATFSVGDNVDDYGYAILHLPDGKILVAGRTEEGGIALARLQGDTNYTNTFYPTIDQQDDFSFPYSETYQLNLTGITAGGTDAQPIAVSVATNDPTFIQNLTVDYTSPDTTGMLSFTASPGNGDTATITVRVEDGGLDSNLQTTDDNDVVFMTFTVDLNQRPTLNPINDLEVDQDAAQQTVSLAGITAGGSETQPRALGTIERLKVKVLYGAYRRQP